MACRVLGSTAAMLTAWRTSPVAKIVDQQLHRFDGHLRLGLLGAGPEVRRADHVGHAEQRALRAGLFDENIEGHAADFAALETFDESRLVVDAAAGAVDQADAGLDDFELLEPTRSVVSGVSGVWTVR